jgi:[acyl-carrier-protein] S-malonyltransferase
MGRSLAESYPGSRETFETADRVLERPISELCFRGAARELALTENTQPALLATSIAAWRAIESRGLRPVAAAGHSLGEYSALVATGTLQLSDALRAVQARARFMQEAVPPGQGAMAAILGLGLEQVQRVCSEAARDQVVSPANLNSPTQIVIAGHVAAVERAIEGARSAGARRTVLLEVSAPFHCALMEPAARRLRPVLEAIPFRDPEFPVFSNVDAAPLIGGPAALDALIRQVVAPVRWRELMERMIASGIETFLEVGPGRVLGGLVRGMHAGARVLPAGEAADIDVASAELGGS